MAARRRSPADVTLPLYQANAFVLQGNGFSGNPAGVCLLPARHECVDSTLQAIAAEVNCSETSFLTVTGDDEGKEAEMRKAMGEETVEAVMHKVATRFKLRWFSPTVEVPLCGHGTLAAAGVLFYKVGNLAKSLSFETMSGTMIAHRSSRTPAGVLMQFPRNPPVVVTMRPCHVTDIIRLAVGDRELHSVFYSSATKKLFLRLPDGASAALQAIAPDVNGMVAVEQPVGDEITVRGVSVTVKAAEGDTVDFMSRYFTPWNGIPEDPVRGYKMCAVNGSSHTNLTPYWAQELGKRQLLARMCSKRGGKLLLEDKPDKDCVMIGGDVFCSREGLLHVPHAAAARASALQPAAKKARKSASSS